MPFDLVLIGAAAVGLLCSGTGLYRITEEAGLIDRGISEDLVKPSEQRSQRSRRFWEVFRSNKRKIDRALFLGGIAMFGFSCIVISAIAS